METNNALVLDKQTYGGLPANRVEMRLDSMKYPRICKLPYDKALLILGAIITEAFMYKGQKPAEDDVKFIAANLYSEIMNGDCGMKNMCADEIRLAIKKSVLGQGEQMYGVNVASLFHAIDLYNKQEVRMAQTQANELITRRGQEMLAKSPVGVMIDCKAEQITGLLTKTNR